MYATIISFKIPSILLHYQAKLPLYYEGIVSFQTVIAHYNAHTKVEIRNTPQCHTTIHLNEGKCVTSLCKAALLKILNKTRLSYNILCHTEWSLS